MCPNPISKVLFASCRLHIVRNTEKIAVMVFSLANTSHTSLILRQMEPFLDNRFTKDATSKWLADKT